MTQQRSSQQNMQSRTQQGLSDSQCGALRGLMSKLRIYWRSFLTAILPPSLLKNFPNSYDFYFTSSKNSFPHKSLPTTLPSKHAHTTHAARLYFYQEQSVSEDTETQHVLNLALLPGLSATALVLTIVSSLPEHSAVSFLVSLTSVLSQLNNRSTLASIPHAVIRVNFLKHKAQQSFCLNVPSLIPHCSYNKDYIPSLRKNFF